MMFMGLMGLFLYVQKNVHKMMYNQFERKGIRAYE